MRVADIGEKGVLNLIRNRIPGCADSVLTGIGDDAAVIESSGGLILLSCDMLVEGVHFLLPATPPFGLGHKSLAASLSDIAAMGGRARHCMVSLALPPDLPVAYLEGFWEGLLALASEFNVSVVGGDTTRSTGPLVIDVSVTGDVLPGGPFLGSSMRPGDVICVTGSFGAAAAGLEVALKGASPQIPEEAVQAAISAHFYPVPRLREAGILAGLVHEKGTRIACRDSSDGLAEAVLLIAEASGCGAELEVERIPVSEAACQVLASAGRDPLEAALYGGEDYELVLAIPPETFEWLSESVCEGTGTLLTAVGRAVSGDKPFLRFPDGRTMPLDRGGYQHFRADREAGGGVEDR